jgi:NAD(P)-dependent dehydrogenase (short-subunit alcohol dehydrogenase family)
MDLELAGKVAVVTGASKGIGLAVARELAAEGALVVAGARTVAPLEDLEGTEPFAVDLIDPDGPARLVDHAVEQHGRLDVLVNNVGGAHPRPGGFLSVTDAEWTASLAVNLLAAVRTTRLALPHLIERGAATIVSTCSVNAVLPDPLVIDYSAAKAALASFSKSLSKELGPRGVRVNTVSPGPVATDLWLGEDGVARTLARAGGGDPDAIAAQAASGSVTGRFSTPQEVADLVVFLASGRAGNTTGADFVIDGGLVQTL